MESQLVPASKLCDQLVHKPVAMDSSRAQLVRLLSVQQVDDKQEQLCCAEIHVAKQC